MRLLCRGPLQELQLRAPSEETRRLTEEAFDKLDFRRHLERLDTVWTSHGGCHSAEPCRPAKICAAGVHLGAACVNAGPAGLLQDGHEPHDSALGRVAHRVSGIG